MARDSLMLLAWQQRKDVAMLRVVYLKSDICQVWRLIPWHGQELHVWMVAMYLGMESSMRAASKGVTQ